MAAHFVTERMSSMREFSWRYFAATGAIDAYLLYKEYENVKQRPTEENRTEQEEWVGSKVGRDPDVP